MRYSLRTLLVVLTTLVIGFGGGIAVEKWRDSRDRLAREEGDAMIPVLRVVQRNGQWVTLKTYVAKKSSNR